ncbi:MAG: DEAD/DEAH box helicase [Bacteroidota bacterium]
MTFEDLKLNKALLQALEEMHLTLPTPIQREAFSPILAGRDVVGVAQTGTGKTLAYLLPLLRQLRFSKQNEPRILVLVPTRELVLQVVEMAQALSRYQTVRIGGVYGGTNIKTQKQLVAEGVDLLVATPGRLYDLAMTRVLQLRGIRQLVIDEVDEMMQLGFRTQLRNIIDILPERRQNLLFSATLSPEVAQIIEENFNGPEKIEIAASGTPLENIEQRGVAVPNFYTKANFLKHLLREESDFEKVLVFVRSKKLVDLLQDLVEVEFPGQSAAIHSNKSQNYRIRSVQGFERGDYRLLLATDLIARGLDFTEVSQVINFDLPEQAEDYLHRIGRTGRMEHRGMAISMVSDAEEPLREAIETLMQQMIPMEDLPAEVPVATELIEAEKSQDGQKNFLRVPSLKKSRGAFHEKKDKNKKVNLGNAYRRKQKAKYKKPIKRSGKKR